MRRSQKWILRIHFLINRIFHRSDKHLYIDQANQYCQLRDYLNEYELVKIVHCHRPNHWQIDHEHYFQISFCLTYFVDWIPNEKKEVSHVRHQIQSFDRTKNLFSSEVVSKEIELYFSFKQFDEIDTLESRFWPCWRISWDIFNYRNHR